MTPQQALILVDLVRVRLAVSQLRTAFLESRETKVPAEVDGQQTILRVVK